MKLFLILLVIAAVIGITTCNRKIKEPDEQGETIKSEIEGVVDYGIGATQLRAKQRATEKIQNINEQHNRELEEALQ